MTASDKPPVSDGPEQAIASVRTLAKDHRYDPARDGVDHINCWSRGRTELGRQLSNFAHTPFVHPENGFFASVEGYWYWLSTGRSHEELRHAHGYAAKSMGSRYDEVPMDDVEFRESIQQAIICKLKAHVRLGDALIRSELPLVHYFVYGDRDVSDLQKVVDRTKRHQWQMDTLDSFRRYYQAKRRGEEPPAGNLPARCLVLIELSPDVFQPQTRIRKSSKSDQT